MADHATPNLPSRDFTATREFYAKLGFEEHHRSDGWMILSRSGVSFDFFPYPDLDPYQSSFGCCLYLDDLPAMMALVEASGIPDARTGIPRYHPAKLEGHGMTIAYLIDPDGTLLRLIQND